MVQTYSLILKTFCGDWSLVDIEMKIINIQALRGPNIWSIDHGNLIQMRVEFENILDGGDIIIAPIVKNGILNQELVKYCKDLQDEVAEKAIKLLGQNTDSESSAWQAESWTMQELIDLSDDDSEFYLCKICSLEYVGYTEEIRGVMIDLNEYAEQLNDLLEL